MKKPVLPRPAANPAPAHPPTHSLAEIAASAENADAFVGPALDAFRLVGRAMLLATGAALALDLAALAVAAAPHAQALRLWPLAAAPSALLTGAAVALLASIQVRYTFEHAHTRKRHFYALKMARFREACAALRSLAVKDAVPAVHALGDLRRETGLLDRRLMVESLILRRRWRDLVWFPGAATAAGCAAAAWRLATLDDVELLPEAGLLGGGLMAFSLVGAWSAERVRRVLEVLSPAPPELAKAFDQTPPVEAAITRLLVRLNHHFDRLRGPAPAGSLEEELELELEPAPAG